LNGPIGVKLAKACVNSSLSVDAESGMDLEAKAFGICFGTLDQKEGMGAFLEKRVPTYRGQ
jgi:enoyl-CoA hydratase